MAPKLLLFTSRRHFCSKTRQNNGGRKHVKREWITFPASAKTRGNPCQNNYSCPLITLDLTNVTVKFQLAIRLMAILCCLSIIKEERNYIRVKISLSFKSV